MHALADVYRVELAAFGIRVLTVTPGSFRTNAFRTAAYEKKFEDTTSDESIESSVTGFAASFFPAGVPGYEGIPDYQPLVNSTKDKFSHIAGKEAGDPAKAAKLLVDVVRGEGVAEDKPFPTWFLLGNDCVDDVSAKIEAVESNLMEWETVSRSTDFSIR